MQFIAVPLSLARDGREMSRHPTVCSSHGRTQLVHEAMGGDAPPTAAQGHLEVLQMLAELCNGDPASRPFLTARSATGTTPIEVAAQWRRPACVEFLEGLVQSAAQS